MARAPQRIETPSHNAAAYRTGNLAAQGVAPLPYPVTGARPAQMTSEGGHHPGLERPGDNQTNLQPSGIHLKCVSWSSFGCFRLRKFGKRRWGSLDARHWCYPCCKHWITWYLCWPLPHLSSDTCEFITVGHSSGTYMNESSYPSLGHQVNVSWPLLDHQILVSRSHRDHQVLEMWFGYRQTTTFMSNYPSDVICMVQLEETEPS